MKSADDQYTDGYNIAIGQAMNVLHKEATGEELQLFEFPSSEEIAHMQVVLQAALMWLAQCRVWLGLPPINPNGFN